MVEAGGQAVVERAAGTLVGLEHMAELEVEVARVGSMVVVHRAEVAKVKASEVEAVMAPQAVRAAMGRKRRVTRIRLPHPPGQKAVMELPQ